MYDLLEHSEGLIGHGDGFVNVNGKLVAGESLPVFSIPEKMTDDC